MWSPMSVKGRHRNSLLLIILNGDHDGRMLRSVEPSMKTILQHRPLPSLLGKENSRWIQWCPYYSGMSVALNKIYNKNYKITNLCNLKKTNSTTVLLCVWKIILKLAVRLVQKKCILHRKIWNLCKFSRA